MRIKRQQEPVQMHCSTACTHEQAGCRIITPLQPHTGPYQHQAHQQECIDAVSTLSLRRPSSTPTSLTVAVTLYMRGR